MILSLVVASSVAAQPPPAAPANPSTLKDASHAIEAGRLEEARLIIGRAIAGGATGAPVERVTADLAFATVTIRRHWRLFNASPGLRTSSRAIARKAPSQRSKLAGSPTQNRSSNAP